MRHFQVATAVLLAAFRLTSADETPSLRGGASQPNTTELVPKAANSTGHEMPGALLAATGAEGAALGANAMGALPPALQLGETAAGVKRKASYYVAAHGETCSEGTLIRDAHSCQEAYDAIKADYAVYPAKRGLVTGSWTGVPVGCSLQFKGSYVDGHGDESPHWNTHHFTDNGRLSSGEFRALCQGEPNKPHPKYVLMPEHATSCPSGMDVAEAACMEAYNAIKDRTVYPARRGLVSGSWNGVPRGCSLQFKGSYVASKKDESPHWNTRSFTDNSRVATGEFRVICKWHPLAYYMAPQGQTCSPTAFITDAHACQEAYAAIKVDYTVYPAERGLVTGSWNGVPLGCSLQFKGSYVDRHEDESPHWNTYHFTDNSRLSSGEFRALCQGEPIGFPPKYVLMPEHATSCPSGTDVAEADCMEAYHAIKDDRTVYPTRRGLVSGSWNGVPLGCSLQFKGSYVASNKDESPHWNTYSFTDNSRVATGEFRVICKERRR